MGRKKIGDLETTMQALGMPADLGELHRPSPPMTAPDTPSREEEELARDLALAFHGDEKEWRGFLSKAALILGTKSARLAAQPADNGVRKILSALSELCPEPRDPNAWLTPFHRQVLSVARRARAALSTKAKP